MSKWMVSNANVWQYELKEPEEWWNKKNKMNYLFCVIGRIVSGFSQKKRTQNNRIFDGWKIFNNVHGELAKQ